jgi:hypothetical protein
MADDIDLANEHAEMHRQHALDADRARRERENKLPTGAVGLCVECRTVLVEEPRIRLGLQTCAECARELDAQRAADLRRFGPGRPGGRRA